MYLSSFMHDAYPYPCIALRWVGVVAGTWSRWHHQDEGGWLQRQVRPQPQGGVVAALGARLKGQKNNIGTNNDVGTYAIQEQCISMVTYLPTYLRYPGTVHIHGDLPTYVPTLSRNSAYPW